MNNQKTQKHNNNQVIIAEKSKVHSIKKFLLIILIATFSLIGVACTIEDNDPKAISDNSSQTEGQSKVEESSTEVTTQAEEPKRTEFFIGEYVNLKDIVVRVINVSDFTDPNPFMQPEEGFVRKAVEVEISNIGSSDYDLQTLFSFEVRDSAGYAYTPNWYDATNEVLTGEIPIGGKARGFIYFDIPENETISTLLYDYALYSAGHITFDLDLAKAVSDATFTNPVELSTIPLGTELKTSSLTVTLNSVKQSKLSSLDAMSNEGYKYLIADVSIKNISNANVYNSSYYSFYAVDTEGFRYKLSIYAEGLRGTIDGDLAPGNDARAEIAFLVKSGVTIDYILYSDILNFETLPVFDLNEVIN